MFKKCHLGRQSIFGFLLYWFPSCIEELWNCRLLYFVTRCKNSLGCQLWQLFLVFLPSLTLCSRSAPSVNCLLVAISE